MKKLALLLLIGVLLSVSRYAYSQRDFSVLVESQAHAQTTTQEIISGNVTLGVTDYGGGCINKFSIPGITSDMMRYYTDRYGRMGQSSIRSGMGSGRYNPTQGGLSAYGGTQCPVVTEPGKIIVPQRPVCAFRADGEYDFTEWEDLADDGYKGDGTTSGHGADKDGIDESSLAGKQATEVTTEVDFYCTYEDYMGTDGVDIPCFRHYYEYEFFRYPGHFFSQFAPGTPLWNPDNGVDDISVSNPPGTHQAEYGDISNLQNDWHLRGDTAEWDPKYRHYVRNDGTWVTELCGTEKKVWWLNDKSNPNQPRPYIILSNSPDRDAGPALGQYRPYSAINENQVVGDGYTDSRVWTTLIAHSPRRTTGMWNCGLGIRHLGLLNRNRTPGNEPETLRAEFYFLVGTPKEIRANIEKISLGLPGGATNTEPVFMQEPANGPLATEGLPYAHSLSGSATDADSDSLIYMKVLGPAWLHLASDGALSGTPDAGDVGLNKFTVKVSDFYGGTDETILNITVDDDGIIESYDLSVNNGNGDGSYDEGTQVSIVADPPLTGYTFDQWTGDVANVANVYEDTTTIIMPSANASLSAAYVKIPYEGNLLINPGFESPVVSSYQSGPFTEGWTFSNASGVQRNGSAWGAADAHEGLQTCFLQSGGASVSQTFSVPASGDYLFKCQMARGNKQVQPVELYLNGSLANTFSPVSASFTEVGAVYYLEAGAHSIEFRTAISKSIPAFIDDVYFGKEEPAITYKLLVNKGTGDGSYIEGTVLDIVADAPASGTFFDQWSGDVDYVADANEVTTTITMPDTAVELTATYTDITSNDMDRTSSPASDVRIYPNPVKGTVHIETTEASKVRVFNVVGQMIYNMQSASTSHDIDVSNWKSGVYIVKVSCAGRVYNQKLIVE